MLLGEQVATLVVQARHWEQLQARMVSIPASSVWSIAQCSPCVACAYRSDSMDRALHATVNVVPSSTVYSLLHSPPPCQLVAPPAVVVSVPIALPPRHSPLRYSEPRHGATAMTSSAYSRGHTHNVGPHRSPHRAANPSPPRRASRASVVPENNTHSLAHPRIVPVSVLLEVSWAPTI